MEHEQVINVAIAAIVFVTMMVIGLDLSVEDFVRLVRKPRPIFAGLLAPFLLAPAAMVAVKLVELPPELGAGVLLIAICPAGNIANLYTSVARAHTALSIVLCVTSILLAFLTMPFWMKVYEQLFQSSLGFQIPTSVLFSRLSLFLILPVSLGMLVRSRFPRFERHCHNFLKRLTLLGVICLGTYIILSDRKGFSEGFLSTTLVAIIFTLLSMTLALVISKLMKLDRRDSITLLLTTPVRNIAIAIAIAVTVLHQAEFAVLATTMFMMQIPLLLSFSIFFRKKFPPIEDSSRSESGDT